MNCKPGDLAVIVCDDEPMIDLGKLVRVVKAAEPDEDGPVWSCDSLCGPLHYWQDSAEGYDTEDIEIPDAWLRPIRDPGNDARDETLEWLPVPTKEHA